jgi:dTDP-4-dehydrorhamnose reductase
MKVLVLGAGGQVGRAVACLAPAGYQVVGRTRAQLDITDAAALSDTLAAGRFDWIVNAAAFTGVDQAEEQVQTAVAINDTAVSAMALAAARNGTRVLQVSTDFVFDGAAGIAYLPSNSPRPLSVYGRSKLQAERHILNLPQGVVLRTSWIYAAFGRNFVLTMLKLMRERDEVRVVCDQIGSPTWANGLARTIWALIAAGAPGAIYHWSDAGVASWYDFAVAIQEEAIERALLQKPVPIVPIRSAQYPARARRPAFSVLNCDATCAAFKLVALHWRENLRSMLDELRAG